MAQVIWTRNGAYTETATRTVWTRLGSLNFNVVAATTTKYLTRLLFSLPGV